MTYFMNSKQSLQNTGAVNFIGAATDTVCHFDMINNDQTELTVSTMWSASVVSSEISSMIQMFFRF